MRYSLPRRSHRWTSLNCGLTLFCSGSAAKNIVLAGVKVCFLFQRGCFDCLSAASSFFFLRVQAVTLHDTKQCETCDRSMCECLFVQYLLCVCVDLSKVCGVDLSDASHEQAVEAIRRAGDSVLFLVQSGQHRSQVLHLRTYGILRPLAAFECESLAPSGVVRGSCSLKSSGHKAYAPSESTLMACTSAPAVQTLTPLPSRFVSLAHSLRRSPSTRDSLRRPSPTRTAAR